MRRKSPKRMTIPPEEDYEWVKKPNVLEIQELGESVVDCLKCRDWQIEAMFKSDIRAWLRAIL